MLLTIPKELMGLFFEDINFAADGGLYAEMIENRSFEAKEAFGIPNAFYMVDDFGYGWSAYYKDEKSKPVMQYVTGTPLSIQNPHYLRITTKEDNQGFSNKAYDGIFLKKGMKYHVSFYARCVSFEGECFKVVIHDDEKCYCSAKVMAVKPIPYLPFSDLNIEMKTGYGNMDELIDQIKAIDTTNRCRANDWVKYEVEFISDQDVDAATFSILLDRPGIVEFDLISMIPDDAVAGIFRKDLFDALKEIHPGFIRFPGGCIVEGMSLENRYQWKQTIGELKDRKYIQNLWAFDDDRGKTDFNSQRRDAHYGQSYGIGFYEYFLLCELLKAKPLPILNIGVACQFRTTEIVSSESDEMQTYIQDALDLIEFANGSADSYWGSIRAKMGHPLPFDMDMIGIGNEQWETKYVDLFKRYDMFEKAIHEKYPQMRLVGTAGPIKDAPITNQAWDIHREKIKENNMHCYAVDEHYYVSPEWMYEHVGQYDDYDRSVGVFAGEYAAHTKNKENNMESALAEAALLIGIERNADVVKLAAYAPLFNRVGHSQWTPDMIWFDAKQVYLTPNYYVQKLFANHQGNYIYEKPDPSLEQKGIYGSVTYTDDKEYIVKLVNANDEKAVVALDELHLPDFRGDAKMWTLEGCGYTFNQDASMPEVSTVTEEKVVINQKIELKAKTLTVIRFYLNDMM